MKLHSDLPLARVSMSVNQGGHAMKLDISRVDVWVGGIEDRPGGLTEKLRGLAQAGANLDFLLARRAPEQPGKAVVFAAPIKGVKQTRAAKELGFHKSNSLHGIRVMAADKPGLCLALTQALADAGINLRGFSGVAVGGRAVFHMAFDSASDAGKATRVLRQCATKA
jgi:hypothetical protein